MRAPATPHSLHISRECGKCRSHPLPIPVWLWVHNFEEGAKQFADFVKQFLPQYESVHSVYRATKNERLDDAKTQAPPASVFFLFLFKRGDDHASRLRQNVRKEFIVPLDVPYYSDVGRYNEVKYQVYATELRLEFYFELLSLFCRANENVIGIHCGSKFMLAATVC